MHHDKFEKVSTTIIMDTEEVNETFLAKKNSKSLDKIFNLQCATCCLNEKVNETFLAINHEMT